MVILVACLGAHKFWMTLALGALAILPLGCSAAPALQAPTNAPEEAREVPQGLYRVTARRCNFAPGAPEDCSRVQYMELVRGERVERPELDRVLITWLAREPSSESEYNVRDLTERRWVGDAQLMLVDDAQGREWFELRGGRDLALPVRATCSARHDRLRG